MLHKNFPIFHFVNKTNKNSRNGGGYQKILPDPDFPKKCFRIEIENKDVQKKVEKAHSIKEVSLVEKNIMEPFSCFSC